ncbi:MAG: septum formation initiator family protein [Acetobacteraceae bacterium]|nr:septum formation initiator family protein [Acetobacteraceae bacterium]
MGTVWGGWGRAAGQGLGRRRAGRPRPGRLVRLVLMVLALYFAVVLIDQQLEIASLERQRAEILERMSYLSQRNGALRQEVERLGSDRYIEQLARDQLGLVGQEGAGGGAGEDVGGYGVEGGGGGNEGSGGHGAEDGGAALQRPPGGGGR